MTPQLIPWTYIVLQIVGGIIGFSIKLAKTKKFMPAGLTIILTAVTLGLIHIQF